jgi:SMI1-KNR4 cell-wall
MQLGLRLPSDYKQFWRCYGAGEFVDPPRLGIQVWDPFSDYYFDKISADCDSLRRWGEAVPYSVYPEVPGLLPWGSDDNGYTLYWLTEGHPDMWPVLFRPPREHTYFERIDLSMTSYLAGCFSQRIKAWCNHSEPVFFCGPERVRFIAAIAQKRRYRYVPYPAPDTWPANVVQLAAALQNSQDCSFALHDALQEAGHPELADHFRQATHSKDCWALEVIFRTPITRSTSAG